MKSAVRRAGEPGIQAHAWPSFWMQPCAVGTTYGSYHESTARTALGLRPGGISLKDAETIVAATTARSRLRAVTLATFTPARDIGDRTLQLALRLLELLGEYAHDTAAPARD